MPLRLTASSHRLDNGLRVLLHEDRSLPLCAVNIWYRVGSKDEPRGRTGFAHLFEHLMFMGTDQVPGGAFDRLMEARGGQNNASTSPDQTVYYAWGPGELLPTLLWLEADRMRGLGRAMTQKKLDLQRDVVRNERRQSYENRPYASAWLVLPELLYPEGHPYHHPVIGSHEDLVKATVDDVRSFFATWYVPENASLVVAGDFDAEHLLPQIEQLFGDIPSGGDLPHRGADPIRCDREIRHVMEDDVPAPRTLMAWPSPARFAEGDAEMELFSDVLTDGASSRLKQALIHKRRLVQDVGAWQVTGALQSEFMVQATALPGISLDEIETIIDDEIGQLLDEGPSEDELRKVVSGTEADFIRSQQELLERANDLNVYGSYLGDHDRLQWDLDRYLGAGIGRIAEVARAQLVGKGRIVLRTVPRSGAPPPPTEESDAAAKDTDLPDEAEAEVVVPEVVRAPSEEAPWKAPVPERPPLDCGPDTWHVPTHRASLVALQIMVPIGAELDPAGREGRSALHAGLRIEGAGDRDAEELAAAIDRLGTDLSVLPGRGSITFCMNALVQRLDESLEILSDVLFRPPDDEEAFQRVHELMTANLEQRAARPDQVAAVVAQRRLLRGLPGQSHPISGLSSSISNLSQQDSRDLSSQITESMSRARVVTAGSIDGIELRDRLGRIAGLPPSSDLARPEPFPLENSSGPLETWLVPRPGAPQTIIRWMRRAPALPHSVSPALEHAVAVLGGSFTSRLNRNLRERHGFTYGAGAGLRQGGRSGILTASTSVQAGVTARATEELLLEIERMTLDPITPDELAKARSTDRTDRIRAFENVNDVVETFAVFAEAGEDPSAVSKYHQRLATVSLDEVRDAAAHWIRKSPGVLVFVGDPERVAETGLTPTVVNAEGLQESELSE